MKNLVKTKKIKTLLFTSLLTILFAVGLSSCRKAGNDEAISAVVAINAASSSSPQDFYVNNVKVNASALAYGQSTGYINVVAANGVQFNDAGSTTGNAFSTVNFYDGQRYSVYYVDDKSIVYTTNDETAPPAGKAKVRFINLSQALNAKADIALIGGAKIVSDLAYKAASAYNEVNAATTFSLHNAGSASLLLNVPVTIQAGKIYTIYFSGTTSASLSYEVVVEN